MTERSVSDSVSPFPSSFLKTSGWTRDSKKERKISAGSRVDYYRRSFVGWIIRKRQHTRGMQGGKESREESEKEPFRSLGGQDRGTRRLYICLPTHPRTHTHPMPSHRTNLPTSSQVTYGAPAWPTAQFFFFLSFPAQPKDHPRLSWVSGRDPHH